ncbi:MAG: hypothetical protein VB070_10770 [Clostridiaceae bacterium]|nr:hypothetical protein [Clostridiaceae bacterium]
MADKYEDSIDFSKIRTFSIRDRRNLVTIENLADPEADAAPDWGGADFDELAERVAQARRLGRPVVWSMGAHIVKNGLSRYIIELIRRGLITHISGNGAVSIHDFELAMAGGTSEDVPTAIEDGSFGMWEETGYHMNRAVKEGWKAGLGYGESLAVYMENHPELFPYRDFNLAWQAWKHGIPATYHIALGTDIIHQHPTADFSAIGGASGIDFKKMCVSISRLDRGVFLNFGSSVIGAEVFLKALSIARNLGYPTFDITTANFDLVDLGDYKKKIGYDDPLYYYRPRKNIVNRPVSRGGKGYHFTGDHKVTIPNLYRKLITLLPEAEHGIRE